MLSRVLIVNHDEGPQCGIYQAGKNTFDLMHSSKHSLRSWTHYPVKCKEDLENYIRIYEQDLIIFNYVPGLFDWIKDLKKTTKFVCLLHEDSHVNYINTTLPTGTFDYYLSFGRKKEDSEKCFVLPRKLPAEPSEHFFSNKKFTVGSFGFGMLSRGWLQIIEKVQNENPCTHINFHIPFNSVVDPDGHTYALKTAELCRNAVLSPETSLTITHDFKSKQELVNFLSKNDLNLFMSQDMSTGKASSSAIEYGLAAKRPIGISSSPLYKDLWDVKDKICVDNNSLVDLTIQGTSILEPFYKKWGADNFVTEFEKVLNEILK